MVVAEGVGASDLEKALASLPRGGYSVEIMPQAGGIYMLDVDTTPELQEVEGVGLIPMIILGIVAAIVGIFGLYFSWKVLQEARRIFTTIPSYAYLIGGVALLVLLYKPVSNLVSSKAG